MVSDMHCTRDGFDDPITYWRIEDNHNFGQELSLLLLNQSSSIGVIVEIHVSRRVLFDQGSTSLYYLSIKAYLFMFVVVNILVLKMNTFQSVDHVISVLICDQIPFFSAIINDFV